MAFGCLAHSGVCRSCAKDDAAPGHCRLKIRASTADLSVNSQLAEIERGFFDLLQSRPSAGDVETKQEKMTPQLVDAMDGYLRRQHAWRWSGSVLDASGQSMECAGPVCSIGHSGEIVDACGKRHGAEVIGFRGQKMLVMPLEGIEGIRHGDLVIGLGRTPDFPAGEGLIGRVLDAVGGPLDNEGPLRVAGREPSIALPLRQ